MYRELYDKFERQSAAVCGNQTAANMQQRQSAALVSGSFGSLQRQLCCLQRQSYLLPAAFLQLCRTPAALLVVVCGTHAALRGTLKRIKRVFIPLAQLHHRISTVKPIKPRFNHGSTFLLFNVDRLFLTDNSPRIVAIFENLNNFQAQTGLDPASKSLTTGAPPPLRLLQCAATQPPCGKETLEMSQQNPCKLGIELTVLGNGESTPAPFFLPFNDRQLFNVFCETAQFETSTVEVHVYNNFTKSCFNSIVRKFRCTAYKHSSVVARGNDRLVLNGSEHRSGVRLIYGEQGTKGTGGHLPVQQRFSCGNVEQSRSEAAATAAVTLRQCDKQRQLPAAILAAAAAICST
ncbi:hypothetical protein B0H16DRAFT_1481413 [Mycena metata]|uniref:Uncharacterized protein n=1 Tax=Mycena metata TaxID=1033252 RepID=A0AAD7GYW0_9AGAR|nr:hypothetical protein B0H16DRAFT_1481413 [Mycena metata]